MRLKALYAVHLFACLAVFCAPVFGQQVNCTFLQAVTRQVDHQKCAKNVIVTLVCTGMSITPKGSEVPDVDITLLSDVPFDTSSTFAESMFGPQTVFPLAQLFVDATSAGPPLPFNAHVAGVGGNGINYSDGTVDNYYSASQTNARSVTFRWVPLDGSPTKRTLTVSLWLRDCDANSSSSVVFTISLTGAIQASRTTKLPTTPNGDAARDDSGAGLTFTVTPSTIDIGGDIDCILLQAQSGSAPANQSLNASLLGSSPAVPANASATLRYSTLFPACLDVRATGDQSDLTQSYNNDLGFTAPGLPSPYANYGTQLQATFNNIPAGVSVFVQTSMTSAAGSVMLTSPGTPVGFTGLTQIPVSKGSATAAWETQTASATATGTFTIPVYFAYQSGVTAPSHITVVPSVGTPAGGIPYLQPPANLIQQVLFSINTGASTTPKMTATVDSRPCIVGVTFWTNNACATSSAGLFATILSDSGPVQTLNPTFTLNGGITAFALSASSTPILAQIFPKVSSSTTPGTYQETMTISPAIGSSSPVSVPFTVTVLPPNNPVFELNAVYDAFSYQSETIAPGQIYTIFGSNFGPSTLITGTLDASGKLSTNVGGTQVMFDNIASPLLYVAGGQLSGVAPFELAGKTSTNVQIVSGTMKSPVVAVPVVPASISIASADGSGGNGAVVLNKDGTLNSVNNAASVGDTVVIYAAFGGAFAGGITGTDGRTTTGPPYPVPSGSLSVTIGGVPATNILYFGNAPGLLESVMQINVVIPPGVPSSPYNSLVISAGGVSSTGWTTIAVQ